jgi:hypothetical protein
LKLLRQYESQTDAETLSQRLRNKGILTYISSKQSRSLSSLYTGVFKTGVWVVLETQHQDAFALLKSSRHKVANPLTEPEMQELERSAKEFSSISINNSTGKALTYLMVIIMAVFALGVLYSYSTNA